MPGSFTSRNRSRAAAREEGSILILVAILLVAVCGFAGMVFDYGQASAAQRTAQAASDAAAEGATYELNAGGSETAATSEADVLIGDQGYKAGDLSITYLDSTKHATTTAANVKYISTKVSQSLPTVFMAVLGIGSSNVSAQSTMAMASSGTGKCVLCLVSTTNGLTGSGSTNFAVTGGNIWVNAAGTSSTSSGSEKISATAIGMNGTYTYSGGNPFTPSPQTNAGTVPDPLASITAPSVSGPSYGTVVKTSSATLSPGIYSGLVLSGSGTLTLSSGTYVFTGSITVSGTWKFSGTGTTLYLTCSGYSTSKTEPCRSGTSTACGSSGAGLTWSGSTTYSITAPTSGTYSGLAIYYDRYNSAGITLSGSPSDNFTGTVYAKCSAATLSGTTGVSQLNSMIVVGSATVSGTGSFNIAYQKSQNYAVSSGGLPYFTQ